jgi:hypothetical protein
MEIVCLVRSQEKLFTREYRAASIGAAQQMGLMIKGALRIHSIEEIIDRKEQVIEVYKQTFRKRNGR